MTTRRILASSALLAAAVACEPKVSTQPPPGPIVIALFDPTTGEIPLPNDLVLIPANQDPSLLPPAQIELLQAFGAQGGFPNDQEVPITIGFSRRVVSATGQVTPGQPVLDFSSFGPSTFFVWGITASGQGEVPLDPITAADFAPGPGSGTLTLHHRGRQPWEPGEYFVFLRGGPNGVQAAGGEPVWPSDVFFLVAQGKDMTARENLSLLVAKESATYSDPAVAQQKALEQAQQLNFLIASYGPAFAVADTRFPHQELAALTTFAVAPRATQVELDPGRGLVPLPIDLLRDPQTTRLTPLAACTLAGGTLDAQGNCSSPAAAGFAALDGFSTTGPLLLPTSDLIAAATVTAGGAAPTVRLYDLSSTPGTPLPVDPTTYIAQPCEVTQSGLSPAIVLQPASATSCDPTSPFRTRPLKENTEYAVVISNGVKDKTGAPLKPGTVAKILLFTNPLVSGTKSLLQGVDDATAGGLEVMRQALAPVIAASGVPKANVAMAYTFKTQSFLVTALQLGALPYSPPGLPTAVSAPTVLTPAQAFSKYGVDAGVVPGTGGADHLQAILETTITTFDFLDPATGAFRQPSELATCGASCLEVIRVLVAVPKLTAAPPLVAPLMVFRHGLGGGRADMLTVADGFAAQGMVTVAIDAAKHGDRSFCTSGAATFDVPGVGPVPQCAVGTCQAILPAGAQGDAAPLGLCTQTNPGDGVPVFRPVSSACFASPASCGWAGTEGVPVFSSNYLISANFFRTRDTFRQDIIDESQLVRAVAVDPSAVPADDALFGALSGLGVVVDPTKIYYAGQSLGAIHGTMTVAANPRISKAVLNVGGGTVVDVFTTSPAFASSVGALLAGLGIAPGTSDYLQFLAVSKTILDPADPVNYAAHLKAGDLPNLLAGVNPPPLQAAKKVLAQVAFCDQVVPNPWSYLWASVLGVGPTPAAPGFGGGSGDFELFMTGSSAPDQAAFDSCTGGFGSFPLTPWAVEHGFVTDWAHPTRTGQAQAAAGAFVVSDTLPGSVSVLP